MARKHIKTISDLIRELEENRRRYGDLPVVMSLDSEGNEYSDIFAVEPDSTENFMEYCADLYSPMPGDPSVTGEAKGVVVIIPTR